MLFVLYFIYICCFVCACYCVFILPIVIFFIMLQKRRLHGTPPGLDDIHLFYYISKFGATMVVPIALLFEGLPLLRVLQITSSSSPISTQSPSFISVHDSATAEADGGGGGVTTEEIVGRVINQAVNVTARMLLQEPSGASKLHDRLSAVQHAPFSGSGGGGSGGDITHRTVDYLVEPSHHHHIESVSKLILLCVFNGFCYSLYNQSSFMVLGRVTFVSHATFNVMRRVFIIVFTSWWFAIVISPTNMIGIFMAMSGFALFLFLKAPGNTSALPLVSPHSLLR
jgi:hypothetical protein